MNCRRFISCPSSASRARGASGTPCRRQQTPQPSSSATLRDPLLQRVPAAETSISPARLPSLELLHHLQVLPVGLEKRLVRNQPLAVGHCLLPAISGHHPLRLTALRLSHSRQ